MSTSMEEILNLIGVWVQESILAELRTIKRNTDIHAKIVMVMEE